MSKICELFFRSLFVQMKIVDELSIVHTWKGCQKKAHVIFLLPVSKISIHIWPFYRQKAIIALILGLPVCVYSYKICYSQTNNKYIFASDFDN